MIFAVITAFATNLTLDVGVGGTLHQSPRTLLVGIGPSVRLQNEFANNWTGGVQLAGHVLSAPAVTVSLEAGRYVREEDRLWRPWVGVATQVGIGAVPMLTTKSPRPWPGPIWGVQVGVKPLVFETDWLTISALELRYGRGVEAFWRSHVVTVQALTIGLPL